MAHFLKNIFERFEALVISFKNRCFTDPYVCARIKIAILFFAAEIILVIIIGNFVDTSIHETISNIGREQIDIATESAYQKIQHELYVTRIIRLIGIGICAYILAGLVLKPLKRGAHRERNFISHVSHELKTPLAVMQTGIEIALRQKEKLTREETVEILENNLEETKRLHRILKFLLAFSHLEKRNKTLFLSPQELKAAIHEAVKLLEPMAVDAGISIKNTIPKFSHATHNVEIEEIFINLIKNALEHTPRGGSVALEYEETENSCTTKIIDTGVGIPSEEVPRIFDQFYRGSNSQKTAKAGLGLGLSIVREIARLYKIKISVESTLAVGTTFVLVFPITKTTSPETSYTSPT